MTPDEFETKLSEILDGVLSKTLSPEEETNYIESLFESIKHINEYGQEFWYARDLQIALEYKEWRNFKSVINKAETACEKSQNLSANHFVKTNKMVDIGSGATRSIDDLQLSRYACYLIVQNANPRKKVVALGEFCFAIKQDNRN